MQLTLEVVPSLFTQEAYMLCEADKMFKTQFFWVEGADAAETRSQERSSSHVRKAKQQAVCMFKPQEASLTFVGSRLRFASHMLKACLGTAPLNHTDLAHTFSSARGLTASQVFEEEKPLQSLA
ncbi:hypothetical protein DY000_02049812 [Brassica cretica]|uniref:Uncharacterized protein n=1 Tax=Brassica cretica TaxID=69181 RepID=A0ABQ7F450_BRACR|nr:hypothetical protein DY000_02049812 [Brassica cretica]